MDAGRTLDALVAEKVMRWIDLEDLDDDEPVPGRWIGIPPGYEGVSRLGASPFHHVPAYSTEIAAAWMVVKKMRGEFVLDLQDRITHWDACFLRYRGSELLKQNTAQAPTAHLAICLAALKAVGVEVE